MQLTDLDGTVGSALGLLTPRGSWSRSRATFGLCFEGEGLLLRLTEVVLDSVVGCAIAEEASDFAAVDPTMSVT